MDKLAKYRAIAEEITQCAGFGDSPLADLMQTHGTQSGYDTLDKKFQHIIDNIDDFEAGELSMYLRGSFAASSHLRNWQPLLDAAIIAVESRGIKSSEIFRGLTNGPYKRSFFV
jgi:hypothetical protein